jgi:hypothetical protein
MPGCGGAYEAVGKGPWAAVDGHGHLSGLCLKVIRNAPLEDPMEVEMEGTTSSPPRDARFVEVV